MDFDSVTEDDLVRDLCKQSLYHFYKEFWSEIDKSSELVDEPHIKYICDWQQQIIENIEQKRPQPPALINQPPSTGKSTMAWAGVTWAFARNHGFRVLYSSHNQDLAIKNSRGVKDILTSEKYQRLFPGAFDLRRDERGVINFKATNGSSFKTASTMKSPIGNHFNLVIIDDPSDPDDALSKIKAAKANRFVDALPSRGLGDFGLLMIMQRLTESDPAGHWLEVYGESGLNWICLPAELSNRVRPAAAASIYSAEGLLSPIRLPKSRLQQLAKGLQSQYAGQYEQHPVPLAGGLLKKDWFNKLEYSDFLKLIEVRNYKVVWNFDADTAYTAKQTNDPSAILCSAWIPEENTLFIKDVFEGWLEADDLLETLKSIVARNLEGETYASQSLLYIEPKASGPTIYQVLRKSTAINVATAKAPTTEKVSRLNGIVPFCASKKVVVLKDTYQKDKWNEKFINQITTVPFSKHDDMADCLVQAIERILDDSKKKKERIIL